MKGKKLEDIMDVLNEKEKEEARRMCGEGGK